MSLQSELQEFLARTGESKRALSLRAGLNPKAVSDILSLPGIRPRHATLARLSEATGLDLLATAEFSPRTYADVLRDIERTDRVAGGCPSARKARSRVMWLMRQAGWVAELKVACRQEVIDFFAGTTPSAVGLSAGSFATYKSDILKLLDGTKTRARTRNIRDIGGVHAALFERIKTSELADELKWIAGSFLLYLHDAGIPPERVTSATLQDYYTHRVQNSGRSADACRKHVRRVARLMTEMSHRDAFADFGISPVNHPFGDGRDRFAVPDAPLAPLLSEFSTSVAPWALGEQSRTGETRAAFLAALDETDAPATGKKARLRAKLAARPSAPSRQRSDHDAALAQSGFLTTKQQWSNTTLATRRGYVVSLAKALYATTDVVIESIEELTDPEILAAAATALSEANAGKDFASSYVAAALKCVKKLARDFIGRPHADIERIDALVRSFETHRKGIAPRNRAKLKDFTESRIQALVDLSDTLMRDVNDRIAKRRTAWRSKHGKLPKPLDVVDEELAREIATALAHEIMMARAPRRANLIGIRLDWISLQDGRATIVIPASCVKGRDATASDLPIPLGAYASSLLRKYVEGVRAKLLAPGDKQNPFLFPGPPGKDGRLGRPYEAILGRLTRRVHAIVGVRMHAHLYRHLIGWIWLKEDVARLPDVSRLLGHKSLRTTLAYYAEIDETLALDGWQTHLEGKRERSAPRRAA